MKNLIIFLMFLFLASVIPAVVCSSDIVPRSHKRYAENRIDVEGLARVIKYEPLVDKYARQYGIPNWVLLGVLYNESNMTLKIVGDHGVGMGMGQVRCSMTSTDRRGRKVFSWFPYLKSRNIPMNVCAELFMDPDVSIRATAAILAYQRAQVISHYENKDLVVKPRDLWKNTILAYNLGNGWRKTVKTRYYYNVLAFGTILEEKLLKRVCI